MGPPSLDGGFHSPAPAPAPASGTHTESSGAAEGTGVAGVFVPLPFDTVLVAGTVQLGIAVSPVTVHANECVFFAGARWGRAWSQCIDKCRAVLASQHLPSTHTHHLSGAGSRMGGQTPSAPTLHLTDPLFPDVPGLAYLGADVQVSAILYELRILLETEQSRDRHISAVGGGDGGSADEAAAAGIALGGAGAELASEYLRNVARHAPRFTGE